MKMVRLFEPLKLREVTLKNRIIVSPMCQYSAVDGVPQDWHLIHLGGLARGGAGLVIAEATAVSPEGRITLGDTGIYNSAQTAAWGKIAGALKSLGTIPGIQIAHAGRKASAHKPWEGDNSLSAEHGAWTTLGPTDEAFGAHLPVAPKAATVEDLKRIEQAFVLSARNALSAGFEFLQLHFAHGYLASSFWSPLSNKRTDAYGGSWENRARFLVETTRAVRQVWPVHLPLAARLSVQDFVPGGLVLEESIELIRLLKSEGLDMIDISVGFNVPDISGVPLGPGMLLPSAARVRAACQLPTTTSWLITDAKQAEAALQADQVDAVTLARQLLRDPHWPYHAAFELGLPTPQSVLPSQYGHWLKR